MKFPIEWHRRNLANRKNYLSRKIDQQSQLDREIIRLQNDIDFSSRQIDAALDRGMDGFDPERFLIRNK